MYWKIVFCFYLKQKREHKSNIILLFSFCTNNNLESNTKFVFNQTNRVKKKKDIELLSRCQYSYDNTVHVNWWCLSNDLFDLKINFVFFGVSITTKANLNSSGNWVDLGISAKKTYRNSNCNATFLWPKIEFNERNISKEAEVTKTTTTTTKKTSLKNKQYPAHRNRKKNIEFIRHRPLLIVKKELKVSLPNHKKMFNSSIQSPGSFFFL